MTQDFTNMLYLFGAAALGREIKTEYCKNNDIPLIRIPYYDYEKINQVYLKERIAKYV